MIPTKTFATALALAATISTPTVAGQNDAAMRASYCIKEIDFYIDHLNDPNHTTRSWRELTPLRERWSDYLIKNLSPTTNKLSLMISGRMAGEDAAQCFHTRPPACDPGDQECLVEKKWFGRLHDDAGCARMKASSCLQPPPTD